MDQDTMPSSGIDRRGFLKLSAWGGAALAVGADGRVATEARVPLGERVRDVKVGADGAVYALTDASPSRILKLTPGSPS